MFSVGSSSIHFKPWPPCFCLGYLVCVAWTARMYDIVVGRLMPVWDALISLFIAFFFSTICGSYASHILILFNFYLLFIVHQQKLDKLFLNRDNMLICVYLYFNNLIYQSQTKKKGVRERKNNKSSKHNLTRAKRLFIWHFLTRAFYLSRACHIVMSTQQGFKRKLALCWRKSKRNWYGTESHS